MRPAPISRFAWWWLRRRGIVTQLNTPDAYPPAYENAEGHRLQPGWQPLHSIRYGVVPVWRCDLDPRRSASYRQETQ